MSQPTETAAEPEQGAAAAASAAVDALDVLLTIGILAALGAILWIAGGILMRLAFGGAPRLYGGLSWIGRRRPVRSLGRSIRERAPRLSRTAAARFDPSGFSGLPLTLILVGAAYVAFLIGGIVEELMEAEELEAVDRVLIAAFDVVRTPETIEVFAWITTAGDTVTLVVAGFVASGFLLAHGPRGYILPVFVTIIGAQATTWSGKFLFDRTRPDFLYDVTAASPSFPSGHATGAMAVYGLIAYILARDLATPAARYSVAFWIGYAIALVAASRVLLHVHWPSDVAVGLLVGTFWLLAGISIAETRRDRSADAAQAAPGRNA